jgi:hypothetical protein
MAQRITEKRDGSPWRPTWGGSRQRFQPPSIFLYTTDWNVIIRLASKTTIYVLKHSSIGEIPAQ